MNGRRASPRRLAVIASALAAGLLVAGSVIWIQIDRAALVNDATQADAVVVLGCAVKPGGKPSPALRARIEQGILVWRDTGSRYLLVTGGVGKNPPAEAVVMADIALRAGVPQSAIIEDTTAHRTEESASVCAQIAASRHWKRVVVVSDPWHLLRARRMFQDSDPALDVRQSPALDSPAWTDARSRIGYMFREVVAYPVYRISRILTGN